MYTYLILKKNKERAIHFIHVSFNLLPKILPLYCISSCVIVVGTYYILQLMKVQKNLGMTT